MAYFSLSPLAIAFMVRVEAVSFAATVRTPSLEMLVPAEPPMTLHVTVLSNAPVPETVALKVYAPSLTMVVSPDAKST